MTPLIKNQNLAVRFKTERNFSPIQSIAHQSMQKDKGCLGRGLSQNLVVKLAQKTH
jgi:hypothetical protein